MTMAIVLNVVPPHIVPPVVGSNRLHPAYPAKGGTFRSGASWLVSDRNGLAGPGRQDLQIPQAEDKQESHE